MRVLATSTELGNVVAAIPKDWGSVLFFFVLFLFLLHVFCDSVALACFLASPYIITDV